MCHLVLLRQQCFTEQHLQVCLIAKPFTFRLQPCARQVVLIESNRCGWCRSLACDAAPAEMTFSSSPFELLGDLCLMRCPPVRFLGLIPKLRRLHLSCRDPALCALHKKSSFSGSQRMQVTTRTLAVAFICTGICEESY